MRKTFLLPFACLALALACHLLSMSANAGGKDKKPAAKATAAEIEKLVEDLEGANAKKWDAAARRLRELPESRHVLRRRLKGKSEEAQDRMEAVIRVHAAKVFKRRLAELAKKKADAPLDLVMELLLEHRRDVGPEQWKQAQDIVRAITEKIRKKDKTGIRLPDCEIRKCKDLIGTELPNQDLVYWRRVIAHRLTVEEILSNSFVVLSESLDVQNCGGSMVLIKATKAPWTKKGEGAGRYGKTFIYSDGDAYAESFSKCLVIARGHVRSDHKKDTIVFQRARNSSIFRLFSAAIIGLHLGVQGRQVTVLHVDMGSLAHTVGMKRGDVIEIPVMPADPLDAIDRNVRRAYVKELVVELSVRRSSEHLAFSLSFAE